MGAENTKLALPISSEEMPKAVAEMDNEHLGLIVATVLDEYTSEHNGVIPSHRHIVQRGQEALTGMGVKGDLETRSKEIETIEEELIDGDDAEDEPPAPAPKPAGAAARAVVEPHSPA